MVGRLCRQTVVLVGLSSRQAGPDLGIPERIVGNPDGMAIHDLTSRQKGE
jgi:hypothetical protein